MIISPDGKRYLIKCNIPSGLKQKKSCVEAHGPNSIKSTYDKPTASVSPNWRQLQAFPLICGTRQRHPFSSLVFSMMLKSQPEKAKRNEEHLNWRGGNPAVIVCRWHDLMILQVESPNNFTKIY